MATTTLTHFDRAMVELAKATKIDEIKDIRDKAEALRAYHKQAGDSLEAQNYCAEIKIRAERRAGQLLKDMPRNPGGRPSKTGNIVLPVSESTLADIGIDKIESSRWQRLADIPDDTFDEHVETTKADKQELTTAGTLRLERKLRREAEADAPIADAVAAKGLFRTIVIDPPWPMQKVDREVRPNQAEFGYKTMTIADIREMELPDDEACHCYLWTTQKFLPAAFDVMAAWGFGYIFTMVWHKSGGFQPVGLPQYNCEFVLFGRKGGLAFKETKAFPCCFDGKRREHSRKPEEFYDLIARVSPSPRIDIFSREKRKGFKQWGNETGKFVA